ncbi:MAG: DUF3489 domain-containing protein [Oricola sp.]
MNPQVPDSEFSDKVADVGTATEAAAYATDKAATKRKPRATPKTMPVGTSKPGTKSKKDQLVALLSKPHGARISVIVERLGWQAHTVRAALSGLRKQGIEIATSKSAKTGETVYVIVAKPNGESRQTEGAAS